MAIPAGAAAYKKKDGVLTLDPDKESVIWISNATPDNHASVRIDIANITSKSLPWIMHRSYELTTLSRSSADPRCRYQGDAKDI